MLETEEPLVFMMRVPQSSLKNLKAYAQLLERQGWEPAAASPDCRSTTRRHSRNCLFNFVDGLDDGEYHKVVERSPRSPQTSAMLTAPDFDMAGKPGHRHRSSKTEQRVRQAGHRVTLAASQEVVHRTGAFSR